MIRQTDTSWPCACGHAVTTTDPLCPACGRFRVEAAPSDSPADSRSRPVRTPRQYPRLPLALALLTLLGLVAYLSREAERPWEKMPVYRSIPVGNPVRIKFSLEPRWRIRALLRVELNRLEFEPGGPEGKASGQGSMEARLDLVPIGSDSDRTSPAQYQLHVREPEIKLGEMPAALSGWEDWATMALSVLAIRSSDEGEALPLRGALVRALRRLRHQRLWMGEAFGVEAGSDRGGEIFPALQEYGKWQGWLGYSVEHVGRVYVRVKLEGGLLWDLPEPDPARPSQPSGRSLLIRRRATGRTDGNDARSLLANLAIAAFLKPLGTIHRIHARLTGGFTADHRSGLPARAAVKIEFRIRGLREGQPYRLRGEFVIRTNDWVRFRSS